MYMSSVWRYILSHHRKIEREWQMVEQQQKWQFYMTRQICHTIHLHTPLKSHTKNIDRFMPSPWEEKGRKRKSNKEIWEEQTAMFKRIEERDKIKLNK